MASYKSHGRRILATKTMRQDSGAVFYMEAAFEEPGKLRFELNFVRVAPGPKNAVVVIYGRPHHRPRDYRSRAMAFLDQNSGEVGRALGNVVLPDNSRAAARSVLSSY